MEGAHLLLLMKKIAKGVEAHVRYLVMCVVSMYYDFIHVYSELGDGW